MRIKVEKTGENLFDEIRNSKLEQEIVDVDLELIFANKKQPRTIFDEKKLLALAQSIKETELIQPIVLEQIENGHYNIVAGERRWRAVKLLGHKTVKAIIKNRPQQGRAILSLIENIQRENLNPLEEAKAYMALINQFGLTHQQISEKVGRNRSTISNMLRLLALEEPVQELLEQNLLEMGHGRALLGLEKNKQIEVAVQIVEKSLSVRQAESLVAALRTKKPNKTHVEPELQNKISQWCNDFLELWNNPVDLKLRANGKGKVIIHVDSNEDIEELIKRLKQ